MKNNTYRTIPEYPVRSNQKENMLKRIAKYVLFSILLNALIIKVYAEDNPNTSTHLNLVLYNFNLFVENTLEEWSLPGAAIAIVQNDSIVFMKGYGLRKSGHPQPIDTHTVFRIASVSKGFASTLTGLLVEDGTLDWQDKVIWYLPEISLKLRVPSLFLLIVAPVSQVPGHSRRSHRLH